MFRLHPFYLFTLLFVLIATPSSVLGQDAPTGFVPLLREFPDVIQNPLDLASFLNGFYVLMIAFGAVLAVIMIIIGGFQIMGSESYSSRDAGKTRIRQAILGLLILLLSYLILYTINPELTDLGIFAFEGIQAPPSPAGVATRDEDGCAPAYRCFGHNNCDACFGATPNAEQRRQVGAPGLTDEEAEATCNSTAGGVCSVSVWRCCP